jgi:[acyl-carrier-protein] S-malonyltransferase
MAAMAYCFPGQGPQDAALVRGVLSFRPQIQDVLDYMQDRGLADIAAMEDMADEDVNALLASNEMASLFTVLYSLGCLAKGENAEAPSALAGYSVGQFIALYAAECFDARALIDIVWQRCLFMNSANALKAGKMGAIIGLPEDKVQALCKDYGITISNYNARGQYTVAGAQDNVKAAIEESLTLGAHKSVMINTQGAWHCPLMDEAAKPFATYLDSVEMSLPRIPVVDNVTGAFFQPDIADIKAQLVKHLTHPVLWEQSIRAMMAAGTDRFIEMGYGNMLSKFGFFISRDATFIPYVDSKKTKPCAA